jgi:hypothetical protein
MLISRYKNFFLFIVIILFISSANAQGQGTDLHPWILEYVSSMDMEKVVVT